MQILGNDIMEENYQKGPSVATLSTNQWTAGINDIFS